jgi:class 3 adenylate cyclase
MLDSKLPLSHKEEAASRLMVFLFTDMVDSVGLKQRLGDVDYVQYVLQPHNGMCREALQQFSSGKVRDNPGDGFFVTFESIAQAVQFALLFQYRLETALWDREKPQIRIGIHLGDATEFQDVGADQTKTAGQAQDLTARLMGLAGGRQILLTRAAFDSAKQYVRTHPAEVSPWFPGDGSAGLELRWLAHGNYLMKGKDEPMEVFEVGAVDYSLLRAPGDSDKAQRVVSFETYHAKGDTLLDTARGILDREQLYETIVRVIDQISSNRGARREIYLAALHGLNEMRRLERDPITAATKAFNERLKQCINSCGPDGWYVRSLFNVPDKTRLAQIEQRLNEAGDVEGFEVRVFVLHQALPILSPMIIGDYDAFIAVDDPTYYRVQCGIHLRGSANVRVLMKYWDSLWNNERAVKLRTGTGVHTQNLAQLREQIDRI